MKLLTILSLVLLIFGAQAQKTNRAKFDGVSQNFDNYNKVEGKTLAVCIPIENNDLKNAFVKSFESYWTHSKVVFINDKELSSIFSDTNYYVASFLRVESDREEASNLSKVVNYFAISYSNGYSNSPEEYAATTIVAMRLSGVFPSLLTSDDFSNEPFSIYPITDVIVKHFESAFKKFAQKEEFLSEEILDFGIFTDRDYGKLDIQGDLIFKPQNLVGKTLLFPKYAVSPRFNLAKFERLTRRRFGIASLEIVETPDRMEQLLKANSSTQDYAYFMIRNDLLIDGCQEYGSVYDVADGEFVGHLTAPRIRSRPLDYVLTWFGATTAIWSAYFGTIYLLGGFD
jgi:hypothetical protein